MKRLCGRLLNRSGCTGCFSRSSSRARKSKSPKAVSRWNTNYISGERRLRASKTASASLSCRPSFARTPTTLGSNSNSPLSKTSNGRTLIRSIVPGVFNAWQKNSVSSTRKSAHASDGPGGLFPTRFAFFFCPKKCSRLFPKVKFPRVTRGHFFMLADRKEEQETLYKEIIHKRVTVREAELIARKIAVERARRPEKIFDQEIVEMESKSSCEALGTRVHVEQRKDGGKIMIDFFSEEDLRTILNMMTKANVSVKAGSGSLVRSEDSAKTTRSPEPASPPTEADPTDTASVPLTTVRQLRKKPTMATTICTRLKISRCKNSYFFLLAKPRFFLGSLIFQSTLESDGVDVIGRFEERK